MGRQRGREKVTFILATAMSESLNPCSDTCFREKVAMGREEEEVLHILVVPYQSEGHVNGMLRLAQALAAEEGVVVTFVYPARFYGLAQKRNTLSPLLSSSSSIAQDTSVLRVEVVEDGLPLEEEHVITREVKLASTPFYQNSVKLLLDDLLHKRTPSSNSAPLPPLSCIISDSCVPWTQDLADAAGLLRVDFWTSTAAAYSMGTQLAQLVSNGTLPLDKSCWLDLKNKWSAEVPLIDCVPGLPPFPVTDLWDEAVQAEHMSDPKLQFRLDTFKHARETHTIMIHSIYELESQVFDALQANGFRVKALGPLLDSTSQTRTSTQADKANHECLIWLDAQSPTSVIYIALGTIAHLTSAEIYSLALGLEACGHPFLWVIRRDSVSAPLSDALPKGFLQQTVDKGLGMIISWAPQRDVLRHWAVGAFFSHCGWNSTLESMWEGVPMVACPRVSEQRSNARRIVENWKIGVELERQQDGSFTKEAVVRAMHLVLAREGKKESKYKERALYVKEVARRAMQKDGSSYSNLVSFLQRLQSIPHKDVNK